MQESKLFSKFALYSFVLILLFAGLVAAVVSAYLRNVVVMGTARLVAESSSTFTGQVIGDSPGSGSLSAQQLVQLDHIVKERVSQGSIAAIRIRSIDGTILYSSLPGETGAKGSLGALQRKALDRGIATSILDSSDRDMAILPDVAGHTILHVVAPLAASGSSGPKMLVEAYKPFDPVLRSVRQSSLLMWIAVLIGAMAAYAAQLVVIRKAEQHVVESQSQVVEVNERLEGSMRDIEEQALGTLQALTTAVDAKDSYTARHALTVTDHAWAIGRHLGLDEEELATLERVGLLHDIGKIGIPENILLKPDRLSPEEFAIVREHSAMGARIVESIPFLRDMLPYIRHHHEHWDGSGYPDGLVGEDIPLLCRILAVADAFDAMTSDRPYRRSLRAQAARAEIVRFGGVQFDPKVVDAFAEAFDAGEITVGQWHERLRA